MNIPKNTLTPTFILTDTGKNHREMYRYRILMIFLGVILSVAAQAQYSPPASGVVSWGRGNGTANDSADSNNATLMNGANYAPGLFGSSFSFDGINDHARVSDNVNLHLTSGLTIGAWVNIPSPSAAHMGIVTKWDLVGGLNQRSFSFALSPLGQAYLALSPGGFDPPIGLAGTTTNVISLNTWTHLAGTYDGSFIRIFVNGQLRAQTAYVGGVFPGTDDLGIGGLVGGGSSGSVGSPFAGRIDEAVIYNRALSASEILTLATVPEPSSVALVLVGSFCLLLVRRLRTCR